MPVSKSSLVVDRFAPEALPLRRAFDANFADPRKTTGERFVWDWWHVPGQYTALRTPAYEYFPQKIYDAFHQRLVQWGRRTLGCHDVSPTWLSCYIDGCEQELHGDLPHGPWAFVYSLTPWTKRKFQGGETLMLRDETLEFWTKGNFSAGLEREDVTREIPALFNRLTVFDPRIPHGVKRVSGTRDPREGRLVIHGWFVNPRPFIEGPLPPTELQRALDEMSEKLNNTMASGNFAARGTLSLRFAVSPSGKVTRPVLLTDSLRALDGDARTARRLTQLVTALVSEFRFKARTKASKVTLPLMFE